MSQSMPEVFAKGWTSTIYHHHTEPTKVVKVLDTKRAEAHFDVERRAYERLVRPGRPLSILQYFGTDERLDRGLVLEQAALGDLYCYLWEAESISPATKFRWARHAAEALAFVHRQGILHCDIHAANFFLDDDLNLKLGDFGAASIDGGRPLMMYRASHQLWLRGEDGAWRKDYSIASEIFALGCVFYNVETRNNLFAIEGREIEDDEIVRKLKERQYPKIGEDLVLGEIIDKCWSVKYTSMEDILGAIPGEQE